MSKWTPTPIKKIGRVITGKTPPTNNPNNYGEGYMFVTPVELHDNFIINSSAKSITGQGLSAVKTNSLNGFSILVGCIGWDMGNVALVEQPCVTNQQINSITEINKDYNPYYVYYWLTLQKQMLFKIANVTRTPILNKTAFEDVFVPIPDRTTQDQIVERILPISQKIALNNRINAELERTARMVYEYMFLQAECGKLCKFGDIIQPNRVPYTGDDKTGLLSMDLSIMPTDSFCLNQKGSAEDFASNQFVMSQYDLLFGSIRPYLKKAGFAPFDGLVNGTILNFRPKQPEDFAFALCALTSEDMFQYAITRSNGNGTRMPTIGADEIMEFKIRYDKDLAAQFGEQLIPYWKLISKNINENFALTEQRNFLLPLLMNGQVRIAKSTATEKLADTNVGEAEQKRKTVFKRLVLSAYILDAICDEPTAGRVKFEKLLYLSEHCAQIPLHSEFQRAAAGPYDSKALYSIEGQLAKSKWFKRQHSKTDSRAYVRLENSSGYIPYLSENIDKEQKVIIDKLLQLFKSQKTIQCEIVATLYGAWNDFLLEGKQPSDDQIVNEVLTQWHESKERIEHTRWLKALEWMRKQNIVPTGYGISTKGIKN